MRSKTTSAGNLTFPPASGFSSNDHSPLARLKESGVLTDEEFVGKKRAILGLGGTTATSPVPSPIESLTSAAPFSASQVNHALVWVNAFVPLFGSVIGAMVAAMGLSQWIRTLIVICINIALLTQDEKQLKAQGYQTKSLGSAWLVPVYLFKRVQVAGGGYGYAVCWMITFFISIFL